ncbi:phosphate transporter [Durotheca rogersii]|uniref:phosphate transporter n=1 Tax=Durotheca rogersii TaxID=419775 RepID=UPI002220A15A|nr:phosphate transporter [Durotheca rogersii]KAI5860406.1 phosphate transporter [Durotheca rogersii]
MVLVQYDYLFAIGLIFAFLDAWNIGANDVANSWATSVASRSLTLVQAMIGASIMEFAGALGVGARVADTIRTKIVSPDLYNSAPEVLMLGMVCAVVASSLWLTLATRIGLPVSTTHSIMGGVIGMGIASVGAGKITWVAPPGTQGTAIVNTGVVSVFMAWIIAPGLSAIFASIIFLITKYGVMLRKNPVMKAFALVPVYFGITASLLVMLLLWKGGGYTINLEDNQLAAVIVCAGIGWAGVIAVFLMPWLWRVVVRDDWQLRWYHIGLGPLLLRRGEVPPPPADFQGAIRNFYEGHLTKEELEAKRAAAAARGDVEGGHEAANESNIAEAIIKSKASDTESEHQAVVVPTEQRKSIIGPKPEGLPWHSTDMLYWAVKKALFNGVDQDIVNLQKRKGGMLSGDLEEKHARAAHYDNKAEFMYSFLQIMTACTASFTHGANDVSNAIGPFTTIYQIWQSGSVPKDPDVPLWILAFGGVAIVLGLWTYGYHIMANLGNRLTLNSPSRGFSMELGSAVTIIVATRLKLPVSTTQCITGAIVGVGLCNGDWRALNWRMIAWIYGGWILTLPCAGIISGCLMGIILNAPSWH